jgi:DNA polymerase I-like protein with 3'-5' exonuclease and polymerase domains
MDEYFERFGEVRDYLHQLVAEAARGTGFTATMLGRRRYCPTCSRTTANAARWPSGWPSTPPSRGRPPTS